MSVLAAVVGIDGGDRVSRMLRASHRIGDGSPTVVVHGDIAVGIRVGLTSGSVDLTSDLSVFVDGWIDELVGVKSPDRSSGAAVIADGYRRFGTALFARVRGDYVLVIVDRQASELIVCRDRAGAKPCYLATPGDTLLAASQMAMIRADGAVSSEPDEGVIAEHLAGSYANPSGTLLRDVTRLPAASVLVAGRDASRTWRHWDPVAALASTGEVSASSPAAHRDDRPSQLAETRRLLDQAVDRRLRCQPVAIELSGGLDSSSVMGTVAARDPSTGPDPDVVSASLRMPAGGHGDEWTYIEEVNRSCGFRSIVAGPTVGDRTELTDQARRTGYLPPSPNGYMWTDLKRQLFDGGFLMTLSGTGGDEWFQRSTLWPAERLHAADLTGVRQALRVGGVRKARGAFDVLARPAVRELAWWQRRVPPWVSDELATRTDLGDRLADQLPIGARRTARGDRARVARSGWGSLAFEALDRHNALHGMETRHPFWDDDLVEFALALPEAERWTDDHPRGFQRSAFADRLPPRVAARRDKAHFADLSIETIDGVGGWDAIATGRSAREGWVDLAELEPVYRRMRAMHARNGRTPGLRPIWNLVALDLWLETL